MPYYHRHQSGFTIIELLVVIAITTILAAIIFPVFAQAREASRKVMCLSHARELGMAIAGYTQDNDSTYPNGIQTTNSGRVWQGEGWAGQCLIYTRTANLYRCPDDLTAMSLHNIPVSYGYNINFIQPGEGYEDPLSGLKDSDISTPAVSVLLFEVENVTANLQDSREGALSSAMIGHNLSASGNGLDNRLYAQTDASTSVENQYATGYLGGRIPPDLLATQFANSIGRHMQGANYVMGDGHSKWSVGSHVSSGINSPNENCHQDNVPAIAGCFGQFQASGTQGLNRGLNFTFSTK